MIYNRFTELEKTFKLVRNKDIRLSLSSVENTPINNTANAGDRFSNSIRIKPASIPHTDIIVSFSTEQEISDQDIDVINALFNLAYGQEDIHQDEDITTNLYLDACEASNPFVLAIDGSTKFIRVSPTIQKIYKELKATKFFSDFFEVKTFSKQSIIDVFNNHIKSGKILFVKPKNSKGLLKASIIKYNSIYILILQPVVNHVNPLTTYGLSLEDFMPHEYIAEFLFLQNSSQKSIHESRLLIENIKKKNKHIESISRFPNENPNPILRFSFDGSLNYLNKSAENSFDHLRNEPDEVISTIVDTLKRTASDKLSGRLDKEDKTFLYEAIAFPDEGYWNIYFFDISEFLREIETLQLKIQKQHDFYERILYSIPNDIAVFDTNHKYLFVNPKGIKNSEIREFIIGKDDFDYCAFKNIGLDLAKERRAFFQKVMRTGLEQEWEDQSIDADLNVSYILRKMSPIYDDNGNIQMVIGHGTDITNRKNLELELLASNQENNRLRWLVDKVNDGIQIIDSNGRIVYLNDIAKMRLGIDHNDSQSHYVWEFQPFFTGSDSWKKHFAEMAVLKNNIVDTKHYNAITGEGIDVAIGVSYEEVNGDGFLIAVSRDITEKKKMEADLERERRFQNVLINISKKYINVGESEIDTVIHDSLSFIGEFLGASRVFTCDYNVENATVSCRNEWCKSEVPSVLRLLQEVPYQECQALIDCHFRLGKPYIFDHTKNGDAISLGKFYNEDIQYFISVPLHNKQKCIGFVTLQFIDYDDEINREELQLLSVFSEMLVNIFERISFWNTIKANQAELQQYNSRLEEEIQAATLKNLELVKSISDQEKFVTIGEITAGVAHDLNTPLAAVKTGLEHLAHTTDEFFRQTLPCLKTDEFKAIYLFASKRKINLLLNSKEKRALIREFQEVLFNTHKVSTADCNDLARMFVKCEIQPSEENIIHTLLGYSDPKSALEALYSVLVVRNILRTTHISTARAIGVVKSLKTVVRSSVDETFNNLPLHKNIKSVVDMFNYEIKRQNIEVIIHVPSPIMITGNEVRLFQLWSNLIKNAIEAMQKSKHRIIKISAHEENNMCVVGVSNSGEMIPPEIKQRIFEKFFTTKTGKGTGLGLSIVSSVISDHNGTITLESNEYATTFTVTLPMAYKSSTPKLL
jgi:PAS domain S-box-containing protein